MVVNSYKLDQQLAFQLLTIDSKIGQHLLFAVFILLSFAMSLFHNFLTFM